MFQKTNYKLMYMCSKTNAEFCQPMFIHFIVQKEQKYIAL